MNDILKSKWFIRALVAFGILSGAFLLYQAKIINFDKAKRSPAAKQDVPAVKSAHKPRSISESKIDREKLPSEVKALYDKLIDDQNPGQANSTKKKELNETIRKTDALIEKTDQAISGERTLDAPYNHEADKIEYSPNIKQEASPGESATKPGPMPISKIDRSKLPPEFRSLYDQLQSDQNSKQMDLLKKMELNERIRKADAIINEMDQTAPLKQIRGEFHTDLSGESTTENSLLANRIKELKDRMKAIKTDGEKK